MWFFLFKRKKFPSIVIYRCRVPVFRRASRLQIRQVVFMQIQSRKRNWEKDFFGADDLLLSGIQKRRYFDTVLAQAGTSECEFNSLSVWRGFMPLHLYKHKTRHFRFLPYVDVFFFSCLFLGTNMVIESSHAARRCENNISRFLCFVCVSIDLMGTKKRFRLLRKAHKCGFVVAFGYLW